MPIITPLLYAILGLLELVLGLRFVLQLLGANPFNSLVNWIYDLSWPLVQPFSGLFGSPPSTEGAVVKGEFEFASLIAMIVYGVIIGLIIQVLSFSSRRREV